MKRLLWLTPIAIVLMLVALFVWQISDSTGGSADAVERALGKNPTLLAGVGDAKALAASTCTAVDEPDEYDCIPEGSSSRQAVRIVFKDGQLSKRFSGDQPSRDIRTAAQVAEALPIDAVARGRALGRFSCSTSVRFEPDGSSGQGNTSGMLCVQADRPDAGARYVELTADGTVARDYAVASPAG